MIGLAFNIESTVLAVTLRSHSTEGDGYSSTNQFVQLYHRDNYHWYLKQQWSGRDCRCHGFDAELPDRLYLSEESTLGVCAHVVDLVWDTCTSVSSDCTAAVVDGREVLLTPLGRALVPPPMSMHRLPLPAPSRHVSFWRSAALMTDSDSSAKGELPWGLACLCDGGIIRLWTGGADCIDPRRGNSFRPTCHEDLQLADLAAQSGLTDFSSYVVRAVQVTCSSQSSTRAWCVVCAAGHTRRVTDMAMDSSDAGDDILLIRQRLIGGEWVWRMEVYPIHANGSVLRLLPWADDFDCIGIGLSTGQGVQASFEVVKMSIAEDHVDFHSEFSFTENCGRKLEVIGWNHTEADMPPTRKYLCVGLSSAPHTSRLYCSDNLLSPSHVSSFTANSALGVLLFVTATAKPLLHFVSLNALHRIVQDIDANLLTAETPEQPRFLFAAPRPVERGARLVCSPVGSSVVVMQMPRGNLEGCDPRPLVLIRSRIMLQDTKYLECLLLLRRQRVDLNLLVDHNPLKFLSHVPSLVDGAIHSNPELLSLLVSSLENGNVCSQKYFLPDMNITTNQTMPPAESALIGGNQPAPKATFNWDNKVNTVCESIRSALYAVISSQTDVDISGALLPLLCTFAKQRPPQLARALYVVKRYALNMDITESDNSSLGQCSLSRTDIANAMSSSKAQKCIKYIAFLCDYKDLFEAALSECDFDMARAVARQGGQMDPKVYLPMLQKLQSSGGVDVYSAFSGYVQTSVHDASLESSPLRTNAHYCLMRFRVYAHLDRHEQSIYWALQCFEVIASGLLAEESTVEGPPRVDAQEVMRDILSSVATNKLHNICFPRLRFLRQRMLSKAQETQGATSVPAGRPSLQLRTKKKSAVTKHPAVVMVTSLLAKIYSSYGDLCHSQGNFKEAVTAYLASMEPDKAKLAVNSAIQSGDWQLALGIGGRFFDPKAEADEGDDEENPFFPGQTVASLDPRVIAQGLIDDYRSTVEQGFGGEDADSELVTAFQHHTVKDADATDNIAARVTDDRAMEAAQLCLEYFDDVEGAVSILLLSKRWMQAAELASRKRRQDLLREEVGGAAQAEAVRIIRLLAERQTRHIELVDKLNALWADAPGRLSAVSGVDPTLLAAIRGQEKSEELEESRSDFGGGTSVYSDMSLASNVSESSTASSTLSMLSDLSLSTQQRGTKGPEGGSFSIAGIEHNLLSRGKADKAELSSYQENKKKRRQRRGKGESYGGKDVFGLKQEGAMARDLYALGDVSAVACAVGEVCDVLLLVGGFELQTLACEVYECAFRVCVFLTNMLAVAAIHGPVHCCYFLYRRTAGATVPAGVAG